MEPNLALLFAAEKVREIVKREGELCGLESFNKVDVCNLPWNHEPPHSWEPAEFEKVLKRASSPEIRMTLSDSKRLAPWRAELCQAELDRREKFEKELEERNILVRRRY